MSRLLPPVYEAEASVLVRPAQPISSLDPNSSVVTADQVSRTYAKLMTQRQLLQHVITDLGLKTTPEELAKSVSVTPEANTTLLQVKVQSGNRYLARNIANKLVEDFISEAKNIQQRQVDQYTARIQGQIQQLRAQTQKEQARIDQLQAQSNSGRPLHPDDQAELTNLQQQITGDRSQYYEIIRNESDIEVNVARAADNVIVISAAAAPTTPVSPKLWLNAGLATLAGLVLAVAIGLLVDHLDQSIKSDEELRELTGLLPLAHIPFTAASPRQSELVSVNVDPVLAEPYKTLRTNVLFSTVDRKVRTIVVTSPIPGEGKSRIAANFAIALAEAGHRVVLVDCDFRRPRQHTLFGRLRNVGLANLILREVPEGDVILPAENVAGLWVITTGPTPPNPSELLSSSSMLELISELTNAFTFVVMDTPPVNVVADPLVVASHADATLVVVEQSRTSYLSVRACVQSLERVGARVAGAILNKVALQEDHHWYYEYGDADGKSRECRSAPAGSQS